MDSIVSFLPLAIVALLVVAAVVIARRRVKAEASGPNGERPYGVGGWLGLFWAASVFIAPLFNLSTTMKGLNEAVTATPSLAEMPAWQSYTSVVYSVVAGVVIWQWFVAYRLKTRYEPSSVHHTRAFLLLAPLLSTSIDFIAVIHYFDAPIEFTAEIVREIVRSSLTAVVWFFYFTVSKRVKNTYYSSPALPNSPAVSPGQVA